MTPKAQSSHRPAGRAASTASALALGIALALALGATAAQADEGKADGLAVSDAWFRTIVPQRPAGGYFTLTNDGDTDRELVGAASPACGMAMLHETAEENGVAKMLKVDHITVPAGGSVEFAPGGYHVMCMKPTDAMKPGNTVPVTLKFEDGAGVTADFAVKSAKGE